jgi:hypothetical protein
VFICALKYESSNSIGEEDGRDLKGKQAKEAYVFHSTEQQLLSTLSNIQEELRAPLLDHNEFE